MSAMGIRRCESCGVFVPKAHPRTARYHYDIPRSGPVVYSLATATVFTERLLCRDCSMPCMRMAAASKEFGLVIDGTLPNGWQECTQSSTSDDFTVVGGAS